MVLSSMVYFHIYSHWFRFLFLSLTIPRQDQPILSSQTLHSNLWTEPIIADRVHFNILQVELPENYVETTLFLVLSNCTKFWDTYPSYFNTTTNRFLHKPITFLFGKFTCVIIPKSTASNFCFSPNYQNLTIGHLPHDNKIFHPCLYWSTLNHH